tara:strand:+ start:14 stop:838 length:825 start_codon:yes stop_codon:yes gene_type:complete
MSSKIKVDTIENVAGSGNVSLGSGHNLVVPGTLAITGASTLTGATTIGGDLTVDTSTLKVDSSNNRVGIGTASPTQDLTIVNSGSARMELVSGTSGTSIIDMGDSSDKDIGGIRYAQGTDTMQFRAGNDVRMSIDGSGRVFKPNQPAFLALGANANYITTSPVPFPTVVYNIGSHYDNSNYTFTAPVAGRYFFHAHMGLLNGSSGAQGYPWFSVNGTQQQYSYLNISATWYANGSLTCIFNLSANDTVKITVSTSSATYYNGPNETRFMGFLVG